MKKILFFTIIIALLLCCFACEESPETGDQNGGTPVEPPEKVLTVSYYDGNALIRSEEYTSVFTPIEYAKDGFIVLGWYTDKTFKNPFDPSAMTTYFEQETLNLYVKTEEIEEEEPEEVFMKDFGIEIEGKLTETEYVVNPIFTWQANGDSAYQVSLVLNGKTTSVQTVSETSYQFKSRLEKNAEYTFVVLGKESREQDTISFRTVANYTNRALAFTLSNPYSNGAVIQRGKDIVFSGKGPYRQLITLTIQSETYRTISDESGYFEITIPPREASFEPISITVTNGMDCKKTVEDIIFGDVYLFSGQSNMQWSTDNSDYLQEDITNLIDSKVRFFCQDITTSATPKDNVKNGRWFKPDQYNCGGFSAIATMTGAFLGTALKDNVPIGIVTAYQGNTNIADWMGEGYYTGYISTKHERYNSMVYPLKSATFSGVVWYQGCNNASIGCDYKDLLKSLFANYRDLFDNQEMPFFVIGLACFNGDPGNNFDFSFVRESQAKACAEDGNAYFISTCDDGDPGYIHPRAKRYICQRVATSIGSVVYDNGLYAEGPSYKSHSRSGSVVTIELNNAEGLTASGEIAGMYLAGADGKYHPATVSIVEGKLVASSAKVSTPIYIKYGFSKSPFVNIFNKDGYAITPFRTDVYGTNIDLFDYDSTANYTNHPDGSEMTTAIVDGNLSVTKAGDGSGFGSIRLSKWGAIAYHPEAFTFTIIGTNSGAEISIRFCDGRTSETWGYQIVDNVVGERTITVDVSELTLLYNPNEKANGFAPQQVQFVEIMVKHEGEASFTLCSARFIEKTE